MDRRTFVKNTAMTGALIAGSGLYAFDGKKIDATGLMYCSRQGTKLPVLGNVDVLVIGGTAAAISSAVSAAKNGASVFLIAEYSYLGEDICGTYQLWNDASKSMSAMAKELWNNNTFRTPMFIKRYFDKALIENGIPFLFNSRPSNILWDENNQPAGVIIANRSGEQVIQAKVIIDASTQAITARIAGCKMREVVKDKIDYKYVVVGNKSKTIEDLRFINLPNIESENKQFNVTEYTLTAEWKEENISTISQIEHTLRDKTWDADQVDSSDILRYTSPVHIKSKTTTADYTDAKNISVDQFISENTNRLYIVSAYSDITRATVEKMLLPVNMMEVGEKIGEAATKSVKSIVSSEKLMLKNIAGTKNTSIALQYSYYTRPKSLKGYYSLELENIPVIGTYDVIVAGGGTAGGPAAIGAARKGAKTLLLEKLHLLGGMGTAGIITAYYHGYMEGFTKEVDKGVLDLGGDNPRKPAFDKNHDFPNTWVKDWKAEWLRKECRKAGVEIWFDSIVCGAVVDKNVIKGVVVSTPYGKGIILGNTVIDSTGSADVAIAAGAAYQYTDNNIAVQGAGLAGFNLGKNYVNTDYFFMDDTDVFDEWKSFVVAKDKFKDTFDLGKLLQTRERRRIVGDYEVSVLDIYNGRTFPDSISFHRSAFDTHGFTVDPFFYIKPPTGSGVSVLARVPARSLLPKGIDGIVVTGLGASAHRDAMPVIRMQACLQNQGYSVGIWAAMASKAKKTVRKIDIKTLQKEIVKTGNLPEAVLTDKDNFPPTQEQINDALNKVVRDYEKLEILFWDKNISLPLLVQKFQNSNDPKAKLVYATLLGLMGNGEGWKEIATAIDSENDWDKGWNYRGMGQYGESMSHLDGMIIALGNSKKIEALPSIHRMAKKLTMNSEFSHFRAIAIAYQTIGSKESTTILSTILNMPGMSGYATTTIQEAIYYNVDNHVDTNTRNHCLKEIFIAESLYRCGDQNGIGKAILEKYANDLCGHYARYASWILKA